MNVALTLLRIFIISCDDDAAANEEDMEDHSGTKNHSDNHGTDE